MFTDQHRTALWADSGFGLLITAHLLAKKLMI
jgi:hypothetical protein